MWDCTCANQYNKTIHKDKGHLCSLLISEGMPTWWGGKYAEILTEKANKEKLNVAQKPAITTFIGNYRIPHSLGF